jgi:hypothetical protein
MIDAGASLIIGHGPHYPQGIEDYRGGRIVYSLGNFIFDEPHKFANRSYVYTTGIGADGAVQDGAVHPVHIEGGVPLLVAGSARARLASLVRTLSERHRLSARATRRRMNNLWFTDIVWRVESMKSWKFVRLPPLYFYFSLGWRGYLRRILPSGLRRRLGRRLARES